MRVISGAARGTQLKTPDGMKTRPTADRVKEAMFSIIQFELPGARVLDLFGGTGQLGIEALSRGAMYAAFVDASEDACKVIRENLKRSKFERQGRVFRDDYLRYLSSCKEKYNVVFLDPPYDGIILETALNRITEIDILQSDGIIVTERPLGKELVCGAENYERSRDYKYGNTIVTLFRNK